MMVEEAHTGAIVSVPFILVLRACLLREELLIWHFFELDHLECASAVSFGVVRIRLICAVWSDRMDADVLQ